MGDVVAVPRQVQRAAAARSRKHRRGVRAVLLSPVRVRDGVLQQLFHLVVGQEAVSVLVVFLEDVQHRRLVAVVARGPRHTHHHAGHQDDCKYYGAHTPYKLGDASACGTENSVRDSDAVGACRRS